VFKSSFRAANDGGWRRARRRGFARPSLGLLGIVATVLALALVLSACGKSTKTGGTVTVLFGTAPDSLDPGMAYTTQALEPDQTAYIPMTTYDHVAGVAGGKLIPGLATALPTVSADGKTYTMTMRPGLVFSNGKPVKASNFTYGIERALKIPWGGSSFITANVVGAEAYAKGSAKTISGITTNDATGQITIKLLVPYGAFDNVLAFPSFAPVPVGTPFKNEPTNPPPGVGPYKITNIVPNVSYEVVKNHYWTKEAIPGIPSGSVNAIKAKISSNTTANALSVLGNSADVFDFADTIPPSILAQVPSKASGRYEKVVKNSTYYFFLNTKTKPFSSELARQAVIVGLDRNAIARLGSGFFVPACYLLPPGIIGHPKTTSCPYGDPTKPDLAKAKTLVKQSGMAGTSVTVWGEMRSPRRQFVDYYTSFLNQIGFKATEKIIADATYFPTIGNLKLNPQTGFADWNEDFPNPIDFYGILIAGDAILPTNNQNFGQINDPVINSKVNTLGSLYKVPTSSLKSVESQWQALDEYTAKKAYVAVYGYAAFPKLTSNRLDFNAAVLHTVFGWDWLTFKLK
jgi:peptide/nickel transport system substrate-binding protein